MHSAGGADILDPAKQINIQTSGEIMKRQFAAFTICSLVLAVPAFVSPASAQDYPTKPIRLVTAYTGGGEVIARLIADKLGGVLKQPVVVEPIPAASGVQAAGIVARAAPDGYTLLAGSSTTHVIKPLTLKSIPYDPVKDFSPITLTTDPTLVLAVRADLGIADAAGLVERSKKTRTLVGVTGAGGTAHVSMLALNKASGASLEHVPYKDDGRLVLGLLGGDVDAAITVGSTVASVLQDPANSKKIRVVGVFNSGPRPGFDNVKPVAEQVPGFKELEIFSAVWGPAGLPPAVVARLNKAINEVLQDPAVRERIVSMGNLANPGTPEQLGSLVSNALPRIGALLKQAGIEPE